MKRKYTIAPIAGARVGSNVRWTFVLSFFFAVFGLAFAKTSIAQCDTIATICNRHITTDYISDGQQYRALLLDEEVAEFHATFYGGSTYRVAACSGLSDGSLIFRLYDEDRNLLFTNRDYDNSPYWDFEINSTLDVIIEAQLDPISLSSGCAVMLIGFKQY
ncbi:MAG: hypothetical protein COA57_11910 [Flavobacteriales bacterium]|nr:hypothetical protein [Bacteroidales bacterium AH-315-I05]PCJ83141.1 MAG: hypothetical protein COA57_11910 [Flavobacteriales bacterium]